MRVLHVLLVQILQFTDMLVTGIIKHSFDDVKQGTNGGQLRAKGYHSSNRGVTVVAAVIVLNMADRW